MKQVSKKGVTVKLGKQDNQQETVEKARKKPITDKKSTISVEKNVSNKKNML